MEKSTSIIRKYSFHYFKISVLAVNYFPIIYNLTQIYLMNLFLLCSTYERQQEYNRPRCFVISLISVLVFFFKYILIFVKN